VVDFSYYCLGLWHGVEVAGVGGGELQAVEEGAAVLEVDLVGGEGVDDFGDGDLDGDAVSSVSRSKMAPRRSRSGRATMVQR
jgi:hypothetical protein